MAISAGPPSGTIERGRGGFMRSSDGKPYVTDPTGALVKGGDRKGMPKRLAYGSPSSRGKQIENTYNLQKWGERRVVMGIGVDLALIADCHRVAQLDPESDEYKDLADTIVMRAKDAAQAGLAADRGTHGHALTEDHDEERDWIVRAEAGEILGLDVEVQRSLVKAWQDCVERNGLEILAVEASCVDDTWRLAGTLDRIARIAKPLRFALVTGEVRVIPAGTVLVLDVKSGKRKTDRDGSIIYWHAYSVQIASYAQSVPYDTEAETRGEWPWPISQEHAVIAHLDVLGAIDGNPSCELVYVDLVAGREHGGATVVAAKAWEARKDVFSVAQLDGDEDVTTASVPAEGVTLPSSAPSSPPAPQDTGESERQDEAGGAANTPADDTIEAEPAPSGSAETPAEHGGEPSAAPVLTPAEQRAAIDARGAPDEGGPADPKAVATLEAAYKTLDAADNTAIKQLVTEAQQGQVPFHLRGNHTVRRFEIVRGLVRLAPHVYLEGDVLRCIVAAIVGDVAHFANVRTGHVLGTLSADEAVLFARLCDEYVTDQIPAEVDEATGHVVLRFPSLAATAA